ncbi:MCE family protein [Aciditerrimonas ferrireducens]|uniref:MCE family protein n=1 Tax=Aciditerrimonas ferrireducens TaxID=667306 RepID=A0ABV6C465_9ACTN|nr:MCE family protein [Aciditerrimonas ferrireducens]MCK4177913.1 MCE family protein [Aciditerrimonas ferrireducens]
MRPRHWWSRLLVALVALAVAVAAVDVVLRFSNGDFSGDYALTASFPEASHGLFPGAEVVYRGVQVGRVQSVRLVDRRALVTMAIEPSFTVPRDARATIEPINVFGADEVALSFPAGTGAPALPAGGRIRLTSVQPGLNGLFAAAEPLLNQVNTENLETVLANLAEAAKGEGPTIARSIDEGAKLAAFLDETLPAQLTALDALNGFAGAIEPTAGSLNAISTASNEFFPTLVANRAAYAKLLADVAPFADNLSQFLSGYRPDIDQLLAQGDDIARLVVADQQDLGQLIDGLTVYEAKFANAVDPAETLPNGTHFGYFDIFVELGSITQLVCSLLHPQLPNVSFLAPLQQALTGVGSLIDCGAPSPTNPVVDGSSATSTPSVAQAARHLSTQLYGILGQPVPASSIGSTSGSNGGQSSSSAPSGAAASQGSTPAASGSSSSTDVLKSVLGGLL